MDCAVLISAALIKLAQLSQPAADRHAATICAVAPRREDAVLMAVTLVAEGGTRPRVMSCEILGDNGHAFGGYQLHRHHIRVPIAQFCRDPRLQAEMALPAMSHGKTIRTRIAAFMGRRENDSEVRRRLTQYERVIASDE